MQKLCTVAFALAMTTAASAEVLPLNMNPLSPGYIDPLSPQLNIGTPAQKPAPPPTALNLQLRNHKTGEVFGTVTLSGNTLYLRNLKDELIGTIVRRGDKEMLYDAKGNVVDSLTFAGGPVKAPDEQP
jgi:hypothetical protein